MHQMTRLEVQFGNPDNNKKCDSEMFPSKSPSLQEAIVSYRIIMTAIMYRCMTDPGYLILMTGYGYGSVPLA